MTKTQIKARLISLGIVLCLTACKEDRRGSIDVEKRPNIVFILSDDHSLSAVSAYGQSLVPTPNIDKIAENGMLFENAFVTSSLCAPSRAAILNGQYGAKSGFKRIGDVFDGTGTTLSNLLQKSGYTTGIVGKWHLNSKPLGFDYYEVVKKQGKFLNPVFFHDGIDWTNGKGHVNKGYFSDIITDKSIDWINKQNKDKPFALFIHHKAPHAPHITPKKYASLFLTDLPKPKYFDDNFDGKNTYLKDGEQPYSKIMNANEHDVYNSLKQKKYRLT